MLKHSKVYVFFFFGWLVQSTFPLSGCLFCNKTAATEAKFPQGLWRLIRRKTFNPGQSFSFSNATYSCWFSLIRTRRVCKLVKNENNVKSFKENGETPGIGILDRIYH